MRKHPPMIASKCSTLSTRQHLMYANLEPACLLICVVLVAIRLISQLSFQRVINKWCMAFLILFEEGLRILPDSQVVSQGALDNWVPMGGEILERNADQKGDSENKRLEGLDLGMQELKTYFRLFMLSTFLLMFMFCSRISKNRNRESGNF